MKILIVSTLILLGVSFDAKAQKKIYFDENRKVSSHKTAKYYALLQPIDSVGNYKNEFYNLNERTSPFTDEDLIPYKGKINFKVTLK